MNNQEIIRVEQEPIISYSLIKQVGAEVKAKIESLKLDRIEATEDNFKIIKTIRAELNNDFKTFEEQRKLVKDLIMKPYNDFEAEYKKEISNLFTDADKTLKAKVDEVDATLLTEKTKYLKEYFELNNEFDFLSFEDVGISVMRSKTDKFYQEAIDERLKQTKSDIETIETLSNKDRILAKYQISKDLNLAITFTNIEIQREEADSKAKKYKEESERLYQQTPDVWKKYEVVTPSELAKIDETVYKATFSVYATTQQLKELKNYMKEKGIKYE
jgi:hypothetical protein